MKKRRLSLVILALCLCAFLSITTACSDEQHQHDWAVYPVKEASCTEEGIVEKVCTCGKKVFESIDSTGHVRDGEGVCSVCGDGSEHIHQFNWDIILDSTCYAEGLKIGTCDCGYKTAMEIETKEHTRNEDDECVICGDGSPAHQHDFTWNTVLESTCYSKGVKTGTCGCGYKKVEFIDEIGHTFNENDECSVCGGYNVNNHPHEYVWETIEDATCISKGAKVGVCSCGFQTVESIEESAHTLDNEGYCSVCGDGELGHKHVIVWETILDATCTTRGAKVGVCHCGYQVVEIIEELGHNRNENGECIVCEDGKIDHVHEFSWVTVEDATCEDNGVARGYCKCGYQTVDFILSSGHTRNNAGECIVCGDGVVKGDHKHSYTFEPIQEATCLEQGTYNAKCFCGEETVITATGKHNVNEQGVCATCNQTFNVYKGEGLSVSSALDVYKKFGYSSAYRDFVVTNVVYNVINNFYIGIESDEYSAEDIYVGKLITNYQISTKGNVPYVSKIYVNDYCLSVQTADGTITDYGFISDYTFSVQRAVRSIIVNQDKLLIVVYNDDTVVVAGKIAKSGTDVFGSEIVFRLCGTGADQYYEVVGVNSNLTEVVIPETHLGIKVASIGKSAFAYNQKIKKVVIADNVNVIKENAFHGCSNLETVEFGSGLTDIGDFAFCACSSLTNVVIPTTITKIGSLAFGVIGNPIFCEATSKPVGWERDWCGRFTEYYFASDWTKVNGVPTKK